jgi:hypothetical protein
MPQSWVSQSENFSQHCKPQMLVFEIEAYR